MRGPCKRQIQYLKKRCIWNRKETVLQPWLSVTKLSVSNTTVAVAHLINVTIDVMRVSLLRWDKNNFYVSSVSAKLRPFSYVCLADFWVC